MENINVTQMAFSFFFVFVALVHEREVAGLKKSRFCASRKVD